MKSVKTVMFPESVGYTWTRGALTSVHVEKSCSFQLVTVVWTAGALMWSLGGSCGTVWGDQHWCKQHVCLACVGEVEGVIFHWPLTWVFRPLLAISIRSKDGEHTVGRLLPPSRAEPAGVHVQGKAFALHMADLERVRH